MKSSSALKVNQKASIEDYLRFSTNLSEVVSNFPPSCQSSYSEEESKLDSVGSGSDYERKVLLYIKYLEKRLKMHAKIIAPVFFCRNKAYQRKLLNFRPFEQENLARKLQREMRQLKKEINLLEKCNLIRPK